MNEDKKVRDLAISCLKEFNPLIPYMAVKEFDDNWKRGIERFGSDNDPIYLEHQRKTRRREVAVKATLSYLAMIPFLLMILVLCVPIDVGARIYKSLMLGRLGNIFPFSREEEKEYELYNKKGRLWPDGHRSLGRVGDSGISISERGGFKAKIENYGGNWIKIDLRSEASKPETDEQLITSYLLTDPIRHLIREVVHIKVSFLGIPFLYGETSNITDNQVID